MSILLFQFTERNTHNRLYVICKMSVNNIIKLLNIDEKIWFSKNISFNFIIIFFEPEYRRLVDTVVEFILFCVNLFISTHLIQPISFIIGFIYYSFYNSFYLNYSFHLQFHKSGFIQPSYLLYPYPFRHLISYFGKIFPWTSAVFCPML